MKNTNKILIYNNNGKISAQTKLNDTVSKMPKNSKINLSKKELQKINSSSSMDEVRDLLLCIVKRENSTKSNNETQKKHALQSNPTQKIPAKPFSSNKKLTLQERLEQFRSDLINKQTQSERRCKKILDDIGVDYKFQHIIKDEYKGYIVDFYLPKQNIVIEVDGNYHNDFNQRKKDFERTKHLKELGVREIFRFNNNEFNYESIAITGSKIEKMQNDAFYYYDLIIYTAGYSKSQLGASGGLAYIALEGDLDYTNSLKFAYTTKNEMDLYSISNALKFAKNKNIKKVLLYTSSKYCENEVANKIDGYCSEDFIIINMIHDQIKEFDAVNVKYCDASDIYMSRAIDMAKYADGKN